MTPNPYLSKYSNDEVAALMDSGSIPIRLDDGLNLLLDQSMSSMFSSSFTIPLRRTGFNDLKVETKFDVTFTELT